MLTHYLVLALRGIKRAPVAAAVNVVTLALGLVALVTAYAFVAFWGRADTQFEDVDRIYLMRSKMTLKEGTFKTGFGISVAEQAASYVKADFPALEKIARVVIIDRKTMLASGGEAVRLIGAAADPEFLELFALPFVAGDPQSALREPRSVVLTQEYAAKLFAGRDPIGQPVLLANSVDATVTGVLAPVPEPSHLGRTPGSTLTFDLLASMDVLEAVRDKTMDPRQRQLMANSWFGNGAFTYLLLPPAGLTPAAMNEQLGAFAARHLPAEALQRADYEFDITPLRTLLSNRTYLETGLSFGTVLLLLGGLVLGVACVNYANLATARASLRAREIGVRKSLGAPPRQIMLQSLLEAGLLTAAALGTAVIVFLLSGPVTRALLQVDLAPTLFADWRVWPFLAVLLAGVTLAAGFYPAFVLSRVRPASAIASADVRLGSKFFSLLLVGTQFAIASFLVLVVMIISSQNAELERTGLGTTEDPLVLLENPANITKVDAATLRSELSRLPQVEAVTEIGYVPWEMVMMGSLSSSPDPGGATHNVFLRVVGFDFFDVFGMPLLAGRLLDREHAEDAPPAPTTPAPAGPPPPDVKPRDTNVVIDRAFAAEFGLGSPEEAVGKTVYRPPSSFGGPTQAAAMNVVGVVEDRVFSLFAPMDTKGAMYQLSPQVSAASIGGSQYTVARVSKSDVSGALDGIDAMWKQLAPTVPVARRFVDDVFNTAYEYYLRINRLFGLLALLAFAISIAGLFGMATLAAARRRQEVGVRKAHGASTLQIVRLLLASFSKPVIVANLVAWPAAIVAGRMYLKQFMNPISLTPLLFVGSLLLMLAIAWLAVGAQTIRAARLTPAQVLRHE